MNNVNFHILWNQIHEEKPTTLQMKIQI